MTEPSNAEVMRRLDQVMGRVETVAADLRADRKEAAELYVRKDVYGPTHEALKATVQAIESDADAREKSAEQFRRQVVLLVLGLAIPLLISFVLAVNNLIANGGAT